MQLIVYSICLFCLNVAFISTLRSDSKDMAQMSNNERQSEMIGRVRRSPGDQCLSDIANSNLSSNTITIVTATDAAPLISQSGSDPPTGFDVDLMNHISQLLNLTITYEYMQFTQFISAVQNNINTISISFQYDTLAREASVNFVDYFFDYSTFIVLSNYTETVNNVTDLCGKTVVVFLNSIQSILVQQQNTTCGPTNQIILETVTNVTDFIQAVLSGSAEVGLFLEPILAYQVNQSNGQLKLVGQPYGSGATGILCNQGNPDLSCALINAINYLITVGTYEALLEQYSLPLDVYGICPSRLNLNGTECLATCVPSNDVCQNNKD